MESKPEWVEMTEAEMSQVVGGLVSSDGEVFTLLGSAEYFGKALQQFSRS